MTPQVSTDHLTHGTAEVRAKAAARLRSVEGHVRGVQRMVRGECGAGLDVGEDFRVEFLGERDAVEEVVQDTFVRAFSSIDSFRGESTLRTWLFTIARRLVVDRRRAARRRKDVGTLDEVDAATEYTALDSIIADEAERRVREAVQRLSPTQREVFTLRVSEGLSYKEIAEIVGTTEGAARVHYHNALRTVRESLYV